MWDRKLLKYNAKQELRHSYWLSFGVCMLAGVLGGGGGGSGGGASGSGYDRAFENPAVMVTALVTMLLVLAFSICFSLFVGGPIIVGKSGFFIRCVQGNRDFSNLFSAFKKGYYLQTVKTMFFVGLYTFLWSLLFIIPGIIKTYQYRMIPYLISENPTLTTQQAFQMSREMTDGEKWKMFVLDWSFIGWYLLGFLALFIGMIFVAPYVEATNAQLYYALCAKMNMKYTPPQQRIDPPPYQGPEL